MDMFSQQWSFTTKNNKINNGSKPLSSGLQVIKHITRFTHPPRPCNTQDVINSLNKVLPIPFFFDNSLSTVTSNENEAV